VLSGGNYYDYDYLLWWLLGIYWVLLGIIRVIIMIVTGWDGWLWGDCYVSDVIIMILLCDYLYVAIATLFYTSSH
jgi:hypothetical protein